VPDRVVIRHEGGARHSTQVLAAGVRPRMRDIKAHRGLGRPVGQVQTHIRSVVSSETASW